VLLNEGIPLYYQIREIIKGKIESGKWIVGDRIPNEMLLAEEFEVSRSTVRHAILDLVREGILTRRQGKGTFVSQPKVGGDFTNSFCYPEEVGTKHELLSIKVITSPPEVIKKLGLGPGEKVYELVRLRYFNEKPASLSTAYLPIKLYPDLMNKHLEGRLFDFIAEHYGQTITKFITYVEPVLLDTNETKLLKLEGIQPALKLIKIGFNPEGFPILLNKNIFRADCCNVLFKYTNNN
jgi:GntR family transcriptional regulator